MPTLINSIRDLHDRVFGWFQYTDGIVSLLMRLILGPVLIGAGLMKLGGSNWFANVQDAMPFPFNVIPVEISWFLATWAELLGGIMLLLGLFTRFWAVALAITMFVAAYSVHLPNGWAAIAPSNPPAACIEGSAARAESNVFERYVICHKVNERTIEAAKRLARGREIMRENGNWRWLNQHGSFVKLNNGIEFAATYMVMLMALILIGGGRWFSLDYYLNRLFPRNRGS